MKKLFFLLFFLLSSLACFSQYFIRTDTIPVKVNSSFLKMPWAGGHNFCQFSDIDLNLDGIKDLFVFDRSGYKITTYINKGTPNTVDYVHDATYQYKFPHMEDWVLLTDYNCDGKEDIFTYAITTGGLSVYRNESDLTNGLKFTLVTQLLRSKIPASPDTLYSSSIGLPAIEDIDGDGDLDIVNFRIGQFFMDYHINKSSELGYSCDSLIYELEPFGCWGNFMEVSCNAALGACRIMNNDSLLNEINKSDNGGSCSLCFDGDGDGDKEFLLGQLACCNMTFLTNGGTTSSANMTSIDAIFPSSTTQVNISMFPCGYFLDVNNDAKRDLLVSPSSPNVSVDQLSIWYYENTGTDIAPVFSYLKANLFQEDMIDLGEAANPVLFDFDKDGLTDMLISTSKCQLGFCTPNSYDYNVYGYKNIGTATLPSFELVDSDFGKFSVQIPNMSAKHLTFGDVDGDGDSDMFVGDYGGFIHYFADTSTGVNPASFQLIQQNYLDNNAVIIDIGNNAAPQLVDADRDGDFDLIIGEGAGNLNYYENIGSPSTPSFKYITNNFGGVDAMIPCCTGYSIPFMFDSAGSYKLMVGSEKGYLYYYTNIDGNLSGNFTLLDSTYQNIWEGTRASVTGKDLNSDGWMDLIIGNMCGGVSYYRGDNTVLSEDIIRNDNEMIIYPNPSDGEFAISFLSSSSEKRKIVIYNPLGEEILKLTSRRESEIINLSFLENGVYFLKTKGEKYFSCKKIVLLK